jgi:hypothetical protein
VHQFVFIYKLTQLKNVRNENLKSVILYSSNFDSNSDRNGPTSSPRSGRVNVNIKEPGFALA